MTTAAGAQLALAGVTVVAALTSKDYNAEAQAVSHAVQNKDWDQLITLLGSLPEALCVDRDVAPWLDTIIASIKVLAAADLTTATDIMKLVNSSWSFTKLASLVKVRHRVGAYDLNINTSAAEFPKETSRGVKRVHEDDPVNDEEPAAKRTASPIEGPDPAVVEPTIDIDILRSDKMRLFRLHCRIDALE
jgi:hypothetical protein